MRNLTISPSRLPPRAQEQPSSPAREYSRAYLHHLTKANEMLGAMLLSAINLAYYQDLVQGIRAAIAAGGFAAFRQSTIAGWVEGDIAAI